MDTSTTYIKMRLAAIPDLGIGLPALQAFHFVKGTEDLSKQVLIDAKGDWYHITDHDKCQLERQDQWQEMLGWPLEYLPSKFHHFYCNDKWIKNNGSLSFSSMEQFWLAFVMKEKFNKTWDGETWQSPMSL